MKQYNQISTRLDRLPLARFYYRISGIIGFSLLLTGFLSYSGNIALAKLVSNGWSDNSLSATFTSTLIFGCLIGSLTGGLIGDYFGRRRAFRINLPTVSTAATEAALVPDTHRLTFFRFLIGTGMGALIMVGYASFTEFIPATMRGKWLAWLSFVGNWSPMLSAVIGMVAITLFSWRIMFLLGDIGMLLVWFLSGRCSTELPRWLAGKGQIADVESQLREVEQRIEREKSIRLSPLTLSQSNNKVKVIKGTFWLLFKGGMLRHILITITILIVMNISLYTITIWISTIFINSGIDVDKSILMITVIMAGAPVGTFIAVLIIDHFPRRLFGPTLLIIIAMLDCIHSIQTTKWVILIYGLVMIFFLYMYVCFVSVVHISELWSTHLCPRSSGFINAVGRIVTVFTLYDVVVSLTHYGSIMVSMVLGVILVLYVLVLSIFGIKTRKVLLEEISKVN